MVEQMVRHAGVGLAADDRGEGLPVVLLHGLTATRHYVVMGSRALERSGHRVIAFDARGHGQSSPAPEPSGYDYADLAADLAAVLDTHAVERAVLAGASMGAHTILRFALEHPGRVAGVVAVTPSFDPALAPEERADQLRHWHELAAALRNGGADAFIGASNLQRLPDRWRATVETVVRQRLERHEHPHAVADALETVPSSRPFERLEDLAAISAPTVIVASRDEVDPDHPLALGDAYARAIPGAQLLSEREGQSPLAWQGGQLSRVIAELAARTELAPD